jgi:hypothetical protein
MLWYGIVYPKSLAVQALNKLIQWRELQHLSTIPSETAFAPGPIQFSRSRFVNLTEM